MEGIHADIKPYDGLLDLTKMPKLVKTAYVAHSNQIQKCYKVSHPDYKYYGAKGVRVRYSKRDFIGWYLHYIKSFKGEKPSVGRIDHDKDYCFANIKIESMKDNISERGRRNGVNGKLPMPLYLLGDNGQPIIKFRCASHASKLLHLHYQPILCSAYGLIKEPESGLHFKFVEEIERGVKIKAPKSLADRYNG